MNRNKFLKISSLASLGLSFMPQLTFAQNQEGFTRNQLIGKGNPDIIGSSYTSTMHKDVSAAFQKMKVAAKSEDFNIKIVSAYRSFQRQKEIFESKYKNYTSDGLQPVEAINKIIEYSTIPGTSRHHWGTDLDIIDGNAPQPSSVLQPEHFHGDGPFCRLKEWLNVHAESYGFYEVYTNDPNRKGFKYEPWHFSFAAISKPMLSDYRKLDLKKIMEEEKIMGNEYFSDDFISKYRTENILDINPKLL